MLEATAAAWHGSPALAARTGTLSYARVAEATEAAAAGLIELGLRRGDRVAVCLPKRTEIEVALYGAMRAGSVAVPVNFLRTARTVGAGSGSCGRRPS